MREYKFIPALSAGYLYEGITKDREFDDGSKMDFYNYDDEFRYPHFLITAGHFFKKDQYERAKFFKKPDTVIFGDSGGFQIATGSIKWDIGIRDQIFTWLENNSTIAANLDIPVASTLFNYDECLNISKSNFKYFHDKQSGKTNFLNVLQGYSIDSYAKWYSEVNEFKDFYGWCVGNSGSSISNMISALIVLLKNKEHLRSKVIHFLGCSNIGHMIIMSHMQHAFNKLGIDIQIYSDSSSPNASRFGYYYYDVDFKNLAWRSLHIPYIRNEVENLDKLKSEIFSRPTEESLPLTTVFDKEKFTKLFSHDDLIKYNGKFCSALILHNTMTFVHFVGIMNEYVKFPEYYRSSIFNEDIAALGTFIDELIANSDSPKAIDTIHHKYHNVIHKFKNHSSSAKGKLEHDFF